MAKERLLELLVAGHSNLRIANELGLEEGTIRNKLSVLYSENGINGTADVARAGLTGMVLERREVCAPLGWGIDPEIYKGGVDVHLAPNPNEFLTLSLSDRELEWLYYLYLGKTTEEIGRLTFYSPRTVANEMIKVYEKLRQANLIKKENLRVGAARSLFQICLVPLLANRHGRKG